MARKKVETTEVKTKTTKRETVKKVEKKEVAKKTENKEQGIGLVDFMLLASVEGANPNGDPSDANYPRTNSDGLGVITDVCIKRKIRNRIQDMGERIFVQSDNRNTDGYNSLEQRAKENKYLEINDKNELIDKACEDWYDVRAFGQVFAFGKTSVGIAGPVTIQAAKSVDPIEIESLQIVKSVNGAAAEGYSSDRMGMKHSVKYGLYVIKGSICPRLAEKTGFSEEDVEKLKEALKTMFDGDESSARPRGSMTVEKVFWWDHGCKNGLYSPKKVYGQVKIEHDEDIIPSSFDDYKITVNKLDGLTFEELV